MTAMTIPALLLERAASDPGLDAIIDDTDRLSYAQLDDSSAATAGWLAAKGITAGDRVALLAPNSTRWLVIAYAAMRIGAVLVPLSTLLRPPELTAQLSVANVRALIAIDSFRGRDWSAELAALDRTSLPSLEWVWSLADIGEDGTEDRARQVKALGDAVTPSDAMAIMFTSGSRGLPKGVIHTHGGALRATAAGIGDRCVRAGTRLYLPMPFFWMGGFGAGIISALVAGATLLTEAAPEPRRTLAFISRERVNLFRGWPDQAAQIAAHPDYPRTDLSALTAGSLDALLPAPMRAQPGRRANLFGMTETFGPYCGYPLDRDMPEDKWGSCGRPFAGAQVTIADPETRQALAAGEIGSIMVSGPNLMLGFCGRDHAETFTPEGWYDTGDIGYLDADGFLFFLNRRDDMVKIKGASVYPSEIETALETVPGVQRAFATELEADGTVSLGAVVVADAGEIDAQMLTAAAKQRLSAFKVPTYWAVVPSLDALPRSGAGKISKPGLQELLIAAHSKMAGKSL